MRRRREVSLLSVLTIFALILFSGPLMPSAQEKPANPPPGARVINRPDLKEGDTWILDTKLASHTKRVIKAIRAIE